MTRSLLPAAALLLAAALTACGNPPPDLSGMPLDELERQARRESYLYSIAMPDTWANWEGIWADLEVKYGVLHQDIDMSSVEELEWFRAQTSETATKDIGDVGKSYAIQAEKEKLLLKYKTSYWDEIPSWAKDDDGDWVLSYTGCVSFLTNTELVGKPPRSWQDVREGDYGVTIGDVISSTQSQYAVLASAYAFGGDVDHLQPAIDFWTQLARNGRLDRVYSKFSRVAAGETEVVVLTDFNSLNYRKQALEQNPGLSFAVTVPQDGSLSIGYSTIISRHAMHPHAAALAREYILSDEGQINLARGFAHPVRDVELPPDVEAAMLPRDQYQNVINLKEPDKVSAALNQIARAWAEEVIPAMRAQE